MKEKNIRVRQLTEKQKRFCEEYVIDFNARGAAVRAGYTPRSAISNASRMLQLPQSKEYIEKLQQQIARCNDIKAENIINELSIVAHANIGDFLDSEWGVKNKDDIDPRKFAAIESFTATSVKVGDVTKTYVRIKMHDKVAALDKLGRYAGIFEKKKEEEDDGYYKYKPDTDLVLIVHPGANGGNYWEEHNRITGEKTVISEPKLRPRKAGDPPITTIAPLTRIREKMEQKLAESASVKERTAKSIPEDAPP